MAVLRTDIERALDELASQENGMRFQGLAVALGKKRWPELIARQRKKDRGLDAYAPATLTSEKIGKGLAASITPSLKKVSADAEEAKVEFPDLKALLFVTSAKVGNADRKAWEDAIRKDYALELHVIEREEIITLLMMPENASLGASHLYLQITTDPELVDLLQFCRAVCEAEATSLRGKPDDFGATYIEAVHVPREEILQLVDSFLSSSSACLAIVGSSGIGKTSSLRRPG
jgi:hypothetical protein